MADLCKELSFDLIAARIYLQSVKMVSLSCVNYLVKKYLNTLIRALSELQQRNFVGPVDIIPTYFQSLEEVEERVVRVSRRVLNVPDESKGYYHVRRNLRVWITIKENQAVWETLLDVLVSMLERVHETGQILRRMEIKAHALKMDLMHFDGDVHEILCNIMSPAHTRRSFKTYSHSIRRSPH